MKKRPITIAPPVIPTRGKVVTIYLDNKTMGCGYRQYLILKVSRKNVTLFYIPQLTRFRIARKEWDAQKAREDRFTPQRLIAAIEWKMAQYTQLGMQYSQVEAKRAIAILSKLEVKAE